MGGKIFVLLGAQQGLPQAVSEAAPKRSLHLKLGSGQVPAYPPG